MIGFVKIGGDRTRLTLSLPWFSVWADLKPYEIACYEQDLPMLADVAMSALTDAAYAAVRDLVEQACKTTWLDNSRPVLWSDNG